MLFFHGELVVQPDAQLVVQHFVVPRQRDLQIQKFMDSRRLVVLYSFLPHGYALSF